MTRAGTEDLRDAPLPVVIGARSIQSFWFCHRKAYFSSGVNRASLTAVEKASFVLCLDEEEYDFNGVSHRLL